MRYLSGTYIYRTEKAHLMLHEALNEGNAPRKCDRHTLRRDPVVHFVPASIGISSSNSGSLVIGREKLIRRYCVLQMLLKNISIANHLTCHGATHFIELCFQDAKHVLLNNQMGLVEILNDEIVVLPVEKDDDGLDGCFALDEYA